mgnify:FL=1
MKLIKLAAAALNQTPFDWDNNLRNIRNAIEAAKRERVDVLCLPELALSGYSCEDAFFSPGIIGTAWELLLDLVEYSKGIAVSVGVPVLHNKALFNCAAFLVDGELLGVVAKKHLCGEGVYYEPRWFKPWPDDVVQSIECNGVTYPLGDIFFDLSGIRLGFEICEDAWVANRPGAQLAMQGADIILNPSASHFAFGKHAVRRRFILDGSRAFNVAYVYSNLVGCEAGRLIFDGGCHIAAGGNLYAAASRFSLGICTLLVLRSI